MPIVLTDVFIGWGTGNTNFCTSSSFQCPATSSKCYSLPQGQYITIQIPTANQASTALCSAEPGGTTASFNLNTSVESQVKGNQTNVTVTYFSDEALTTLINNPYNPGSFTTGSTEIWAKVSNNTDPSVFTKSKVTLTVHQKPLLLVTNPAPVCAPNTADITADAVTTNSILPSGTTLSYYTDDNGAPGTPITTTNATALGSGVYWIKATTGTTPACSDIKQVRVTVNALPTASISGNSSFCEGTSTVLTASATAGSGTVSTYQWNLEGEAIAEATGSTYTATAGGNYSVTVTNSNGCSVTSAAKSVTVNALPVPTAGSNSPQCTGSTLNLTSSGGTSYSWTGPGEFASTDQNPSLPNITTAASGAYEVTVTDGKGCSAKKFVTVTINDLPTISVSPSSAAICSGKSASLAASGATSYTWSPSAGLSAATGSVVTASPATTTTYTVTGTDANSCRNTTTVTVTVNALPTASITGTLFFCAGSSTLLTADATAGSGTISSYQWNRNGSVITNATNVTYTATEGGNYTVTVANSNGCTITSAAKTVTVNALPDASASSNAPRCVGTTLSLNASGGVSYSWTGPNGFTSATQNPSISNVTTAAGGTYNVTVTDGNGCSATASTSVVVNTLPVISVTPASPAICTGSSQALAASGAGTYSWSPATGLSATTGASVTASPTATTTYTVTGIDGNSCTNITTVTVRVNALPLVSAANKQVCFGNNSVALTGSPASGVWSSSNAPGAISGSSFSANGLSAGNYPVTYTYTDGNNCTNSASAIVKVNALPPAPKLVLHQPSLCAEGATGSVEICSPETGFKYTLLGGASKEPKQGEPVVFTGLAAGSDPRFTVTDLATGCTSLAADCSHAVTSCEESEQTTSARSQSIENKPVQPLVKTGLVAGRELLVQAYPNPYSSLVNFRLVSPVSGAATLEVYDLSGRKLAVVYQGPIEAGISKTINYTIPPTQRGGMIYKFSVGEQSSQGKLLPGRDASRREP